MQSPAVKEQTPVRINGQATSSPRPPSVDAGAAPPTGAADLMALTDDALSALVEQGQAEIVRRKQKKEAEFLAFVADTARTLGVGPARLAAAISRKGPRQRSTDGTDGRSRVLPKFWCVTDHSLRWSGRGGAPKWFSDHISAGGKEDDMRIPDGVQ